MAAAAHARMAPFDPGYLVGLVGKAGFAQVTRFAAMNDLLDVSAEDEKLRCVEMTDGARSAHASVGVADEIRFDAAREGISWFADYGSSLLVVALPGDA